MNDETVEAMEPTVPQTEETEAGETETPAEDKPKSIEEEREWAAREMGKFLDDMFGSMGDMFAPSERKIPRQGERIKLDRDGKATFSLGKCEHETLLDSVIERGRVLKRLAVLGLCDEGVTKSEAAVNIGMLRALNTLFGPYL